MTTSQFINQQISILGISQYRLSQLSGISCPLIANYCNGVSEPSITKFKAIVQALHVHRQDLNNFIYEN